MPRRYELGCVPNGLDDRHGIPHHWAHNLVLVADACLLRSLGLLLLPELLLRLLIPGQQPWQRRPSEPFLWFEGIFPCVVSKFISLCSFLHPCNGF